MNVRTPNYGSDAPQQLKYPLIGGCADGSRTNAFVSRIEAPVARHLPIANIDGHAETSPMRCHVYRPFSITADNQLFHVYAWDRLMPSEILSALIDGYKPPERLTTANTLPQNHSR